MIFLSIFFLYCSLLPVEEQNGLKMKMKFELDILLTVHLKCCSQDLVLLMDMRVVR